MLRTIAMYTVDNVGNRTGKFNHLTGVPEAYDYDQIYQLTEVLQDLNGTPTPTEGYTYDAVGNRLSSLGLSPYSYNSSNHLTSTPAATFTYDNNGNTTSKVDANGTTSYSWSMADQLTSVTLPNNGGTVSFNYDVFGRRVRKVAPSGTIIYLYDGAHIIAELDASGNVLARYTQGPGIDEPLAMLRGGVASFYHADGLGTVTALTDSAGSAAATYTYDAFGQPVASSGSIVNPFRYTAREWDAETGTYFYRARYYDQTLGRFASEDPLRFLTGINFYVYVSNQPVGNIDPLGLGEGSLRERLWEPVLFAADFYQGLYHMGTNYLRMRRLGVIGSDRYFHCMANCEAAKTGPGGLYAATVVSNGREVRDFFSKPGIDYEARMRDWAEDDYANRTGQSGCETVLTCETICGKFGVPGLP